MENSTELKPPKKILVLELLTNLIWMFGTILSLIVLKLGSTAESIPVSEMLFSIAFILSITVVITVPLIKRKILFPRMINWEKDSESAQKAIKLYQISLLALPILFVVIGPFFSSVESGVIEYRHLYLPYCMVSIGNGFLVGGFFGSKTLREFEEWSSFVPVEKKFVSFSMTSRIFIYSFACTIVFKHIVWDFLFVIIKVLINTIYTVLFI